MEKETKNKIKINSEDIYNYLIKKGFIGKDKDKEDVKEAVPELMDPLGLSKYFTIDENEPVGKNIDDIISAYENQNKDNTEEQTTGEIKPEAPVALALKIAGDVVKEAGKGLVIEPLKAIAEGAVRVPKTLYDILTQSPEKTMEDIKFVGTYIPSALAKGILTTPGFLKVAGKQLKDLIQVRNAEYVKKEGQKQWEEEQKKYPLSDIIETALKEMGEQAMTDEQKKNLLQVINGLAGIASFTGQGQVAGKALSDALRKNIAGKIAIKKSEAKSLNAKPAKVTETINEIKNVIDEYDLYPEGIKGWQNSLDKSKKLIAEKNKEFVNLVETKKEPVTLDLNDIQKTKADTYYNVPLAERKQWLENTNSMMKSLIKEWEKKGYIDEGKSDFIIKQLDKETKNGNPFNSLTENKKNADVTVTLPLKDLNKAKHDWTFTPSENVYDNALYLKLRDEVVRLADDEQIKKTGQELNKLMNISKIIDNMASNKPVPLLGGFTQGFLSASPIVLFSNPALLAPQAAALGLSMATNLWRGGRAQPALLGITKKMENIPQTNAMALPATLGTVLSVNRELEQAEKEK